MDVLYTLHSSYLVLCHGHHTPVLRFVAFSPFCCLRIHARRCLRFAVSLHATHLCRYILPQFYVVLRYVHGLVHAVYHHHHHVCVPGFVGLRTGFAGHTMVLRWFWLVRLPSWIRSLDVDTPLHAHIPPLADTNVSSGSGFAAVPHSRTTHVGWTFSHHSFHAFFCLYWFLFCHWHGHFVHMLALTHATTHCVRLTHGSHCGCTHYLPLPYRSARFCAVFTKHACLRGCLEHVYTPFVAHRFERCTYYCTHAPLHLPLVYG